MLLVTQGIVSNYGNILGVFAPLALFIWPYAAAVAKAVPRIGHD